MGCIPFSFAAEFQRMRECLADLGCTPVPIETAITVDVRTNGRTPIIGTSYQTILQYDIPDDFKFQLKSITISLIGFSTEFVVEYSRDLLNWEYVRSYVCNVQSPNFSETLPAFIERLPKLTEPASRFRIRARANGGAGDNLQGSVFASLNGFLLSYS